MCVSNNYYFNNYEIKDFPIKTENLIHIRGTWNSTLETKKQKNRTFTV